MLPSILPPLAHSVAARKLDSSLCAAHDIHGLGSDGNRPMEPGSNCLVRKSFNGFSRFACASIILWLVFGWGGAAPAGAADIFYQKDGWTGVVLASDQNTLGCAVSTSLEQVSLFGRSP